MATKFSRSTEKDLKVPDSPIDTISQLSFSPNSYYFSASSWDKSVRIYEANQSGSTRGVAMYNHDAPVLTTKFSPDGVKVASGGGDCLAKVHDLQANKQDVVAKHDLPISSVAWAGPNILVTGSWDKTIKYWDLRKQTPIGTINLPAKVLAMDVGHPLLAAALSNNDVACVNLENPFTLASLRPSLIKDPLSAISVTNHPLLGFVLGSVSGRGAVQALEPKQSINNRDYDYNFKAIKENSKFYSLNALFASKNSKLFIAVGGDGSIRYYNSVEKIKITTYNVPTHSGGMATTSSPTPVTAVDMSFDSKLVGYATGYDWSKGCKFHSSKTPCQIKLHVVEESDLPKK